MRARGHLSFLVLVLALAALTACEILPPAPAGIKPQARPAGIGADTGARGPSQASRNLAQYYARVQSDLLARGLLRVDGGGPDTPFTDTTLVRNFERIALQEEYVRGGGFRPSTGGESRVKKWTQPVRVTAEFGTSVPSEDRRSHRAMLARYVGRLARVTGHPITMSDTNANFHVLFMSEDDRDQIKPRIRALVPDVNPSSLAIFDRLPRAIHCLVIAFSDEPGGYNYGRAIALVRTEHPDLLLRSCIHEEVAQGLGVGNDSPNARPSIFNDDDEFALLTTHDEMLLRILYNPRLRPGMSLEEARPIVADIAAQLMGGPS